MDKLAHLADVVSYADFAPTDSQVQVDAKLSQEIAHDREQMDGVLARPLAAFNATAARAAARGDRRAEAVKVRGRSETAETVSENQNFVDVVERHKSDTFVSVRHAGESASMAPFTAGSEQRGGGTHEIESGWLVVAVRDRELCFGFGLCPDRTGPSCRHGDRRAGRGACPA